MELLREKVSQFQEENSKLTTDNEKLHEENSEMLARVETLQSCVMELKSR